MLRRLIWKLWKDGSEIGRLYIEWMNQSINQRNKPAMLFVTILCIPDLIWFSWLWDLTLHFTVYLVLLHWVKEIKNNFQNSEINNMLDKQMSLELTKNKVGKNMWETW